MDSSAKMTRDELRGLLRLYTGVVLSLCLLMGLLHLLYSDLRVGHVYWFNLDKERNIPTWFSGALFFIFGVSALLAWYGERLRCREVEGIFRLPILWLGVALAGFYASLDEITILHENLFWREVRQTSDSLSGAWRYLTQWQILFAPAFAIVFAYFIIFFSNRFSASSGARRRVFIAISLWVIALLLEGVRKLFKAGGDSIYSGQVLVEEELEMLGAVLLMTAVFSYAIDISTDFSDARRASLAKGGAFLTPKAIGRAIMLLLVLSLVAALVYGVAWIFAKQGAPLPGLFRRAVG